MNDAQIERFVRRNAGRNFWLNVVDGGIFQLGLSMVSRYTVLPLFVERMAGERWMQGLIPAIWYAGWLLPGLFLVPLVASMDRRKPWMLPATFLERVPWLLLGLLLLLWPTLPQSVLLPAFFVIFSLTALGAGLTSTAWQDFVARVTPPERYGIFFGIQNALGGVLGVLGAGLAFWALAELPFPQSVGALALACFVVMMVSFGFLASTVEPRIAAPPRQTMWAFLGGIGPMLERDRMFRRYLFCRSAIAMGLVGHSFLTAAALERFDLPDSQVGLFTGLLLGSQAISAALLGWLSDRWGHKQVLELSTGLGLLALVLAIVAPTSGWYLPIFVLVGASQAGFLLAGFALVFAFSPPADRPAYIGVANTALGPVAALGPVLAGWLAELMGYEALFLTLALIGVAGVVTLHLGVVARARLVVQASEAPRQD
jgi:MFS family permease